MTVRAVQMEISPNRSGPQRVHQTHGRLNNFETVMHLISIIEVNLLGFYYSYYCCTPDTVELKHTVSPAMFTCT